MSKNKIITHIERIHRTILKCSLSRPIDSKYKRTIHRTEFHSFSTLDFEKRLYTLLSDLNNLGRTTDIKDQEKYNDSYVRDFEIGQNEIKVWVAPGTDMSQAEREISSAITKYFKTDTTKQAFKKLLNRPR